MFGKVDHVDRNTSESGLKLWAKSGFFSQQVLRNFSKPSITCLFLSYSEICSEPKWIKERKKWKRAIFGKVKTLNGEGTLPASLLTHSQSPNDTNPLKNPKKKKKNIEDTQQRERSSAIPRALRIRPPPKQFQASPSWKWLGLWVI